MCRIPAASDDIVKRNNNFHEEYTEEIISVNESITFKLDFLVLYKINQNNFANISIILN